MASTLRKLADKLEGKDKQEHDNPQSSNFGPHSTATANKVDPRVDSDVDGRNNPTSRVGGYGNTQTTGTHTGPGVAGGATTHHTTGIGHTSSSTTTGPHNSDALNKLDPRVDSTQTTHTGAYGSTHATSGTTGVGHTTTSTHPQSTTAGPHNSNLANKLDPRVDSDLSNTNTGSSHTTLGSNTVGHNTSTSHTASGPGKGTGYGNMTSSTGGIGDNPQSTNTGPHSSNLLNKLDPRVDSDVDGRNDPTSRVGGYGQTQTGHGTHGAHDHTTTTGTHTAGGTQGYTGTNTAYDDPRSTNTGPHSSNLLNKLDPRVDSDRDGRDDPTSRTGGYGQTQTGSGAGGVGRY